MKKYIKELVILIIRILGWIRHSFDGNRICVVLCYHSINRGQYDYAVSTDNFRTQLEILIKRDFQFITAKMLENYFYHNEKMPFKTALLTFDDGYQDFVENALPLLKERKAFAVIFVHTDRKSDGLANTLAIMPWPTLRDIQSAFIDIQSHSHVHPDLKTLTEADLERDFKMVATEFGKYFGRSPFYLAYPGGKFNQTVIDKAKHFGYKLGFTIDRGSIGQHTDPFRIPRFCLSRDTSLNEFKMRISLAGNWYEKLIQIFK